MSIKLDKSEEIIHIVRKHALYYFTYWFFSFLFIVAPFFLMFWLFNQGRWGQIAFFTCLTIGLWILVRTIFLWKKNSAIITTHSVVDVEQKGFFEKNVAEIP